MLKIAKFEKVSFEQFAKDATECLWEKKSDDELRQIWESIQLPERATVGSAGYDFRTPFDIYMLTGFSQSFPTGIRVWIQEGWVLQLYPRSSLGFKYRTQLDNTVGIIDSDYYQAKNEGHIMVKITNDSTSGKPLSLKQNDRFMQGIFVPFGVTVDDNVSASRVGGMGSTGNE